MHPRYSALQRRLRQLGLPERGFADPDVTTPLAALTLLIALPVAVLTGDLSASAALLIAGAAIGLLVGVNIAVAMAIRGWRRCRSTDTSA